MAAPDWLSFARVPEKDGIAPGSYFISAIKKKYNVEPLPGGFFVFFVEDIWVDFAVLEDVGESVTDDGRRMTEAVCIFYGGGPSGNLRECRHTYWGEDNNGGYIFYPSGSLIIAAFRRLGVFFDDMTGDET